MLINVQSQSSLDEDITDEDEEGGGWLNGDNRSEGESEERFCSAALVWSPGTTVQPADICMYALDRR